ncbi:hypothetical protein MNBD_GAMMA24-2068 [hydrothermal vent metagenome]|uniref:Uncharacterized protein n=1 Tax=hydrothermal vent metagenome TaxID=652676 RepID=A0A3B1BFV5_9ZZZZ
MILNNGKICHLLPRLLHGKELICLAEQGEVRPQDAAQESYPVDDDLIVVQYVNVIGCSRLHLIDQCGVVIVEFVVPRHVDYGRQV